MENNNMEEAVVMADPNFNKDDFSWEITSTDEEAGIKEETEFKENLETFKNIVDGLDTPEDRVPFILDFYDNVIPDTIWNKYMEQFFKTKIPKNINMNSQRKLTLIDYSITKSAKSLNDVRYKTSNCERSTAWLINEDANFANEKPEILSFFKVNLYAATAKIQEEKVQIPFHDIGSTLKEMETKLPYIHNYCFYKIFGYLDRKVIRCKGVEKIMESDPAFAMGVVRYRNSETFGNLPAWNAIIRTKTIIKDIGYFTVSSYTKYIGNIWVDPSFRRKGIMEAMFKFIKHTVLPVEDFLFISTKNPTVLAGLSLFNSKFIGKDIPYISDNAPYQLKQKLNQNYLENVYCIAHKEMPSNEKIHTSLNGKELLYSRDSFPLVNEPNNDIPSGIHLMDALKEFPCMVNNPIKVICKTNDVNVVPEYYNYYSPTFKNHSNTHIVYELNRVKYTYPCFDNEELFPVGDIHIISKKIEDFRIDVLFNGDETIVIKHVNNNDKILFRGKLTDANIGKEQIKTFFEYIQYGIERVKLDSYYHAVEIINNEVKFLYTTDTSIVIYKNIEEVIKNFSIN